MPDIPAEAPPSIEHLAHEIQVWRATPIGAQITATGVPAAPFLTAQVRRETAVALRAVAETPEIRRRFIDRHPHLHEGVTVNAVLLAVADEIENPPARQIGEADGR